MKKIVIAAVVASMIGTPVMAAQQSYAPAKPPVTQKAPAKPTPPKVVQKAPAKPAPVKVVQKAPAKPAPVQYKASWKRGEKFDQRFARNYKKVDYKQFNKFQKNKKNHLKAPPRGYQYVQSGNDIIMVAVATGIIASIFAGFAR